MPATPQVHHRLFVCCSAREQSSNTKDSTTVINIKPGSERLAATGLKVRDTLAGCVPHRHACTHAGPSQGWLARPCSLTVTCTRPPVPYR